MDLSTINFTDPSHREHLAAWRVANLGRPGSGQLSDAIKRYLKGIAPAAAVLDAMLAYGAIETKATARQRRHERQAWVRASLVDGHTYPTLTVWQPERGEFELHNIRFTVERPSGESLQAMHNFGREVGGGTKARRRISDRIGYLQEVLS